MLLLLLPLSLSDTGLTLDDLAVGIMSGKELLMSRLLAQAVSWVPGFREVYVYSDAYPNTTREDILSASPHANLQFVSIENRAEHLIGTQWLMAWYHAQPRFLPAMHHLWVSNPRARWFLFCDDDTYLYAQAILRMLSGYNSSAFAVVSHFWCSWDVITQYMLPTRDCHPFAQGGSGVFFSRAIMDRIGPELLNCSQKYNDAEHAASMRVSVCVERIFGYEEWTKDRIIQHWKTGLHPGMPSTAIATGCNWEAPGGFHQVSPNEMLVLKGGHLVDVEDGFFDFNFYSMKSVPIEITYRRYWQMHFGFSIDNFGTHSQRIHALGGFRMVQGGTFVQQFEGNVTIVVVCNQTRGEEHIHVDEVVPGPNVTVYLELKCPPKQKYAR
jgi:hypothetical protein